MVDLSFLNLGNLEVWLENKPPDEEYDFKKTATCPLTEFIQSNGVDGYAGVMYIYVDKLYDMPEHFNGIVKGNGLPENWTYGKALKRCRGAIKSMNRKENEEPAPQEPELV